MTAAVCIRCRRFRHLRGGWCSACWAEENDAPLLSLAELEERLEQHRRHRAEVEESLRRHPSKGKQ